MSQTRIQDYGSPVIAASLKELGNSLAPASILTGNSFVADGAARLRINPGTCITNQGVIINETEAKFLNIPNTSNAVDYTIFYSHTDQDISGGVPAILTLQSGILTPSVVAGVILGYVRYTGAGAPLSSTMFVQPYPVQIGKAAPTPTGAEWVVPINNIGYMITSTSGSALSITSTWDTSGSTPQMYLLVNNNNLSTGGVVLTFPFKVKKNPYALFQSILSADINATINPLFIDSSGVVQTLVISPLTGIPNLAIQSIAISPGSVQNPNSLVYVQLQIQCAAGRKVRIQALGLNEYNLPY